MVFNHICESHVGVTHECGTSHKRVPYPRVRATFTSQIWKRIPWVSHTWESYMNAGSHHTEKSHDDVKDVY